MNCSEVNQKIELFVLGALSKSEEIEIKEHLITCPACNTTEADYRSLVTKIKEAAKPKPLKLAFIRRIRSAVQAEISSIAFLSLVRRTIAITGSVAGCLLFTLMIMQVWVSSDSKKGNVVANNLSKESLGKASSTPISPSILEAWQYRSTPSVPGSMADEVVVHRKNMYLLQEHEKQTFVAAIDIKTGKRKWLSDIQSCGYIFADDSRVYCLSQNGIDKFNLAALDIAGGKVIWKYHRQNTEHQQGPCRPILLSNNRICWTFNNTVHMLNCTNGKPYWTHSITDGGLLSSVVAVDNDLYVANSSGFHCLNAATGNEAWRLGYGGAISSRCRPLLSATEGEIYASLSHGLSKSRLICMEIKGRRILWSKTLSHVSHMYAVDNILYIRNQNIQALDGATGQIIWNCPATGCNPVTYTEELVYFVDSSSQGCLKALDRYTGSKVWELGGMKSCNAFIKVDSTGFLKNQDGIVYAINLKG